MHNRGKQGDRYPEHEPSQTGRARDLGYEEAERVVRRKERPARPPPVQIPKERDKTGVRDRQHDRDGGREPEYERYTARDQRRDRDRRRDRDQDLRWGRAEGRDRDRDRGRSLDRELEGHRHRDKGRQRARTRSRERGLEDTFVAPAHSRHRLREGRASWEGQEEDSESRTRGRHRVQSSPNELFGDHRGDEGRGGSREFWDLQQGKGRGRERSHSQPSRETGITPSSLWVCGGVWCAKPFLCGSLRWWVSLTAVANTHVSFTVSGSAMFESSDSFLLVWSFL